MKTLLSPISLLLLSYLRNYTSTLMIMMKLLSMLCRPQESSMSKLPEMSSHKSWSINVSKNILTGAKKI